MSTVMKRLCCPICKKRFWGDSRIRRCCSSDCFSKWVGSWESRFWKRVKKTSRCWEWQGPIGENGYPERIKRERLRVRVFPHRMSFELKKGIIPKGKLVLHKCDNRKCVRPSHLFLGTQKQNIADAFRKGRKVPSYGEMSGTAKLTEKKVLELLSVCAKGPVNKRALAKKNGISYVQLYKILKGEAWAHLPRPAA